VFQGFITGGIFVSKQSARGLVRARWVVLTLIAVAAVVFAVGPAKSFIHHDDARSVSVRPASQPATITPATRARINASFAALPLAFEANEGQTDSQVKYMARGNGYKLFLTSSEAVLTLPSARLSSEVSRMIEHKRLGPAKIKQMLRKGSSAKAQPNSVAVLRMQMLRSNPKARLIAEDQQAGKVNYFIGNDSSKWHSNIPLFGRVTYRDVYPGVDLAFHGLAQQLEFDYLVRPRADPGLIALGFQGADEIQISADGDLILTTATGPVQVHRPFAYQVMNGSRRKVDARFVAKGGSEFSFAVGDYDRSRQLVIDPTVTYSTYFGGTSADYGLGITVDAAGNAFVTGASNSATLPGNGGPTLGFDGFVTEISSSGSLVFTTLFGGSADDFPGGIAVDSSGVYIAGTTDSNNFPATVGQTTFLGGTTSGNNDAFAVKLALNGAFTWGTYIAGSESDSGLGVAVDSAHNVYVVGETFSVDLGCATAGTSPCLHSPLPNGGNALNRGFPPTNPRSDDGYIAKLNPSGTGYVLLSYIGGRINDLATGVAVDATGNIFVSGDTISTDLPVTFGVVQGKCGTDGLCNAGASGPQDDAFIASIAANLSGYNYLTYYGGSGKDDASAIAVDSSDDAFVTGNTSSSDFPTHGTPFQSALAGTQNAFVLKLNPTATVANYSTYLGGSGTDIGLAVALDSSGDAYVTGQTSSINFPAPNAVQTFGGKTDAFVTVLTPSGSGLLFSTFLGGSGDEDQLGGNIVVDSSQNIYVTGDTDSSDFPTKKAITGGGTYGGGSCLNSTNVSVPCPDAFVTTYTSALAPDFTITASALSPATVAPGGSATSTITIGSLNGYTNTVNLSCSVSGGGTPAPTCSFSSNSVAGGSGTSTLTVNTTGPTGALFHRSNIFYAMFLPLSGLALIGTGFGCANSRRRKVLGFLMLYAILAALLLLPACGGGGGSHPPPHGGTPAGTYTITVTGTDGTLTHPVSPALVLTVN
jgi:hypothetical protein